MQTQLQDKLVTVFGGSGFLGRYTVRALLERGARVRIALRDANDAWFLKTQGGLGQTQFIAADICKPESVARALIGADAAINLVGILKGNFEAIQTDGARNVAQGAANAGCSAIVHISAIGADPQSTSRYGRTKGLGEGAVQAAFPAATILRPSIVFGREDGFINRFAELIGMLPVVPVIRGPVLFQPVYVGDVANAIAGAMADPKTHGGKIYELGGPQTLSMEAINRWIANAIGHSRMFVPMPDFIAGQMAKLTGWLPGAPMTNDQWLMLQRDNVVMGLDGLKAMGIRPTPMEAVAPGWLVKYRRLGRFADATKG
jgi:uncharacterized protein YbjT (DUF2867 family)